MKYKKILLCIREIVFEIRRQEMERLDVTEKIVHYISSNNIAVEQIAKDTHISASKLRGETKDRLMSAEFLTLCHYLNVKPEDFQ